MNVDRLAELSRPAPAAPSHAGRYEMRPLLSSQADIQSTEGFLNEVSHIMSSIQTINANVSRIRSYQSAMLQSADSREEARNRAAIDDLTNETNQIMSHVKQKIKEIQPTSRHSDLAVRNNQFATCTRAFMDAIQNNRQVQVEFQKAESRQLERQIRIANPSATQEEIDHAVAQAEEGRPAVFAQQLMQSMTNEQRRYDAQQTLDAVQTRHEDIRRLAKSVQELQELFMEMQFLIENQGKVLDQVEENATQAAQDLEKGTGEINKAINSARATRRKKWICFGIFIVIVIIVVVVVVTQVVPKNNGGGNNEQAQPAPSETAA